MKHRMTMLLILGLIGTWGIVGVATAQIYYADDFSTDTIANYETAGGATWKIENGELVASGAGGDWNVLVVKEALWKGWTDYTYEVKATPDLTTKTPAEFIYIVFRYAQPIGTDRLDFYTYLMDETNVVGLYIDRFIGGTRTRPVPGTMAFEGAWKNEAKAYNIKLEVTKDTVTGFWDGTQQFTIPDNNLVDGRIGLGVWGADARFDDLSVFGPAGVTPVDPAGKVATTWGEIKAKF